MHSSLVLAWLIGVVGGTFLVIAPFTRTGRAISSRQLRVALWIAGASCLGWGLLGLIDLSQHQHLSNEVHSLLHHFKDLLGGSSLGILLLQFISGEFSESNRRYREMRRLRAGQGAR